MVRDSDDKHYETKERFETAGPHWLARPVLRQDGAKKAWKPGGQREAAWTLQPG